MKKKILFALLMIFLVMQAFRPEKNTIVNPDAKDIQAYVSVPDSVLNILKVSCYDCHSNTTNYHWYHEVMPFGWVLNHHVQEGKEHLNFSEFSKYDRKKMDHKLEECAEEVQEHEMPLESYLWAHEEAKLSPEQIKLFTSWVNQARAELQQK